MSCKEPESQGQWTNAKVQREIDKKIDELAAERRGLGALSEAESEKEFQRAEGEVARIRSLRYCEAEEELGRLVKKQGNIDAADAMFRRFKPAGSLIVHFDLPDV